MMIRPEWKMDSNITVLSAPLPEQQAPRAVFLIRGKGLAELEPLRHHPKLLSRQAVDEPDADGETRAIVLVMRLVDMSEAQAFVQQLLQQLLQEYDNTGQADHLDVTGMLATSALVTEIRNGLIEASLLPSYQQRLTDRYEPLILELSKLGALTRWLLADSVGTHPHIAASNDLYELPLFSSQWFVLSEPVISLNRMVKGVKQFWARRIGSEQPLTLINVKLEDSDGQSHPPTQRQKVYRQLLRGLDSAVRMYGIRRVKTITCYLGNGEFALLISCIDSQDASDVVEILIKRLQQSLQVSVSESVRRGFTLSVGSASEIPGEAGPIWLLSQLADMDQLFGAGKAMRELQTVEANHLHAETA